MNDIQKLRELAKQRISPINLEYSSSLIGTPHIKTAFAALYAKELVSVQPMNLPTGLVFYMDYKK